MSSVKDVVDYYAARAEEYQEFVAYADPRNAAAMAPIRAQYQLALRGHDVLELACGPGYWTQAVAVTARSILATDIDPVLVTKVRNRLSHLGNVRCQVADVYSLENVSGLFTAAFSQYWWSHIPVAKIRSFLATLHSKLAPGALVLFLDALPYPHCDGRRIDEAGDVLEGRLLRNGERYEILKNFPTRAEILSAVTGLASDVTYKQFASDGYWYVSYRTLVR